MRFISSIWLIVLMVMVVFAPKLRAQPTGAVYPNQGIGEPGGGIVAGYGTITTPESAAGSDKSTFAALSAGLGQSAALQLVFALEKSASGTSPVTVYVRTDLNAVTYASLVSISAQTSSGASIANVPAYKIYYLADGTVYLAVTISSTFKSIRINLLGTLLVSNIRVYNAFYGPSAVNSSNPYPYNVADCGLPNVTTTSIDPGLLSLLSVDNLTHAIDNNATGTQSSFRALLGVSGLTNSLKMRQIFYFSGPSHTNDAVRFILSKTAPLVSATLLGKISVQAYRGDTLSGSAQVLGSVLDANLLGLFDTGPITFFLTPRDSNGNPVRFDRVEVTLEVSGLTLNLGAIPLNIHDVRRVPSIPQITNTTTTVCDNIGTIVLSAVSNLDNLVGNLSYKWYNSAGTQSASDKNLSLSQLTTPGTVSYYVDIKKDGCETASGRRKVDITVIKAPNTPNINLTP